MKTNLKIYFAACSVMAALCSCNQEAVIEGASINQDKEAHTIALHANLGMDSRIAFEENETSLNLLWEKNDGFSVMVGKEVQTPVTFTLIEGEGTSNGKFEGNIHCNDGDTLYAVWPIMENGMSGEHQCYWSLAGQKGVLDDKYTFMIGSCVYEKDGITSMAFRPMTAALRVHLMLPDGVEKITKVDLIGEMLGREGAIVNIDSGGLLLDGSSRNDGVTIENEFIVVDGAIDVVAYFFAWDWTYFKNGRVVVTADNGKQYEGTLANGNLRPGKLYDTTVELAGNLPEVPSEGFVEEADGSYTIYTAEGFKYFAALVNAGNTFEGKTVKLGADIDLNNELQIPIGVQEQLNQNAITFAGTLDGQNHCIKNLKIDNSVGRFTGLFAYVQKAIFKNLRIASGEVKGTGNGAYVGAFLGFGRGVTFINCHNEGCKVIQLGDNNGTYAGGLTGALNRTADQSKYSVIIACTNSAEVSGNYCPAGITGGAWGGYVNIVACVNTGKISYSGSKTGELNIYAAGIASSIGGNGWLYGCFSDCEIVPDGYNHSGLVSDLGYTGSNIQYSYSTNTDLPLLTFGWGGSPENKTVGYSSYNNAVENLNKGIDMYNWTATIPCEYKFVSGNKPTLVYTTPSTKPGAGNNDFGNGGKF